VVALAPVDYAVLALFFAIVLALGFSARLKSESANQIVVAGRALPLPIFVATLVATWYGGVLGTGQVFGYYGFANLTVNCLPYWVFGILFALFFARRVRSAEQISLPERIESSFGKTCGLIAAFLIAVLATPAPFIMMLGTLFALVSGLHVIPATVIAAIVSTLFVYRGGLLADARSNTLGFAMMYVAFIIILIVSISRFGAPGEIIPSLPASQRSWDAGNGLLWVLSWFVIGSWTFVDPGFHQRVVAVGSAKAARIGVLAAVGLWIVFDNLTTFTAMYATHATPNADKLGLDLFPVYGSAVLASGIRGVFFAGMFGALLAATVGYTFVSGTTLGRDLFARIKGERDRNVALPIRLGIAASTAIGIALALGARENILNLWYDMPSIVIPGLIAPVVGAYVPALRISSPLAISCMIAGCGSALAWNVFNRIHTLPISASITPIIVGLGSVLLIWGIGLVGPKAK
jgi:SSS family solute:Na+ symporter